MQTQRPNRNKPESDTSSASRSDDQLRYFAESASEWLWETDENHRFIYLSPNVERIVGTPAEWHYGKTREDWLGEDYDRDLWDKLLASLRGRKPFTDFVYCRVCEGMPSKWLTSSGLPIFDDDGRFTGYRGIGRDITVQKEAELALQQSEAELREIRATLERHLAEQTLDLNRETAERIRAEHATEDSERRFRHAFEYAPIGIALLTPDGRRLRVNQALADFLGDTVENLRNTPMANAVASLEDYNQTKALRQEIIDGKRQSYTCERAYRRKDGQIVWGEVTGSLVRDKDNSPLYFVAHTVDTTERRRTMQLLREANEKLEQRVAERTRELNASNAALRQEIAERERIEENLRNSESRFQDFAKSSSDWFWETDEKHRFKAFLDPKDMLPKAERQKFIGLTRIECVGADLTESKWQKHQRCLDAHRPFRNFRYGIPTPESMAREWSINGRPIFGESGEFLGYRGTGSDITEQVNLERKLAEQATLMSSILDSLPLHVALRDLDCRYTFINRYGAEKMSRTRAGIVGKSDSELLDLAEDETFTPFARNVIATGIPVVNRTIRPAHWGSRDALLNIVPVNDASGAITGVLIVAQDVTELSQAQAVRREHEALLDAILEHIPAFLTMKNLADDRYLLTNERFNRAVGLPKELVTGRKTAEVFPDPKVIRTIVRHERRVIESRKAVTEERETIGMGGPQKMSITKYPVFDDTGNVISIGSVTIDISEQRKLEEQLRQAQKMETVGQLTGGIAHDFNNLLGVVIGNLDFLEEKLRSQPELHQWTIAATNAALHGGELTQQLLAFSRRQPLAPQSLDLNRQLSKMHDLLRRTLGETVAVDIIPDGNLWHCLADPAQVETAVLNLAINARDAMPEGGTLTLATDNVNLDTEYAATALELEPGAYVKLSVTDTGTGMSPETVERAFEPFFTTKKVGEGSGLGLSMVFGFAKQSGGHAAISSTEGNGTTVNLYLPVAQGPDASTAKPALRNMPRGNGEKILVVEDDSDLQRLTVAQLQDLGYSVVAARDGDTALDILDQAGHIDLLLTDIVLPNGMDGFRLSEKIKAIMPDMNILFMSGYSDRTPRPGSAGSTVPRLQKPFRKASLAQAVRDSLDRSSTPGENAAKPTSTDKR